MYTDSECPSESSEDVRELVSSAIAAAVCSVLLERAECQLSEVETRLRSLSETAAARLAALTPVPAAAASDGAARCIIPSSRMRRFTAMELMALDTQATRLAFCRRA